MENLRKSTLVGLGTLLLILATWGAVHWLGMGQGGRTSPPPDTRAEGPTTFTGADSPSQTVASSGRHRQLQQAGGRAGGQEAPAIALDEPEGVMASVYGEIPSSGIQISEETRGTQKSSEPPQKEEAQRLPSGFGLKSEGETKGDAAVTLETPFEKPPKEEKSPSQKEGGTGDGVEAVDPREIGINTNDGPEANYEETVLTVQRTLTAVTASGEKQLIRLKIPVLYKSRSLRLEGESLEEAKKVLENLRKKREELARIKTELETILKDWNKVVTDATPHEVLLPESPTLPTNQSSGKINREGDPSMSAGKAITYEIINKEGNKK